MSAPMCTLKPTVPAPSAPKVYANNIPPATAANVVDVVNALRAAILGSQGGGGGGQGSQTYPPPTKPGPIINLTNAFQVVKQVVNQVKVYDPNDLTGQTYVTVAQVQSLTLQNPNGGATWEWTAPQSMVPGGSQTS